MNRIDRRKFIIRSGMAIGAGLLTPYFKVAAQTSSLQNWAEIRSQFSLAPDRINMALMLLASHPKKVTAAIEMYRKGLDHDPVTYWEENRTQEDDVNRFADPSSAGAEAEGVCEEPGQR